MFWKIIEAGLPAISAGLAIYACYRIKGKTEKNTVKMPAGFMYFGLIFSVLLAAAGIVLLFFDEYRMISPAAFVFMLLSLFVLFISVNYRIVYDDEKFEYRTILGKTYCFKYSEILKLKKQNEGAMVEQLVFYAGEKKKRVEVTDQYVNGKEFIDLVKEKFALYHGQTN